MTVAAGLIPGVAAAAPLDSALGDANLTQPRTLSRSVWLVEFDGKQTGDLLGRPIDRIGLFAWDGTRMEPIPFQVDERDANGRWILPEGDEPDRSDDGGRLGDLDVVVVEAKAVGNRYLGGAYQSFFPSTITAATELEFRHPKDGTRGWVYGFAFEGEPIRSTADLVTYDPVRSEIIGQTYRLRYDPKIPVSWKELRFKQSTAADASWSDNLIDRIKIRIEASLGWGLLDIERNEEQFNTRIPAYKDGPIRVIRRQINTVDLVLGIQSPETEFEVQFLPDGINMPIKVMLPFRPDGFFSDLSVLGGIDFRDMKGWRFFTSNDPTPVTVDGTMSSAERSLSKEDCDWIVFYNDNRAFIQRVHMGQSLKVTREVAWEDDATGEDPPEYIQGQLPMFGYRMKGWENLDAGTYTLGMASYNIPDYRPGKEKAYLELLGTPIGVTANAVTLAPVGAAIAKEGLPAISIGGDHPALTAGQP
ncbi:MAG: hypothetical protein KC466_06735 [Myxococcales bacterium]|nr:hypothetical protein [Myxococcales bacterium]